MLDFYFYPTPNGLKVKLFLEETRVAHRVVPVNLNRGDQFKPEYAAISPNNRMPAIVDHNPTGGGPPLSLFESGAILLYLAEKTGRLIPSSLRGRADVLQWLFWQMSALGPMSGQNGYFRVYAPEPVPFAIERYGKEASSTGGSRIASTSSASTRSPISPATRGSCRTSTTASGSKTSRICSAGSRRSRLARRP